VVSFKRDYQYHAQTGRVENALFIGKWKVAVNQGYRYLENVLNR